MARARSSEFRTSPWTQKWTDAKMIRSLLVFVFFGTINTCHANPNCKLYMYVGDTNKDGYMDATEYVGWLNRMSLPRPAYMGATFATLPQSLQELYTRYAASYSATTEIDINGAGPGTQPTTPEQGASLDALCTEAVDLLAQLNPPPTPIPTTASPGFPSTTTSPVFPGQTTAPVEPGQTTAPVFPGQTTTAPATPGQTTAPVVPGQTTTAPVTPGQPTAPVTPGQTTAPVVPGQTTAPVIPGQTTAPVVPGQTTAPVVNGQTTAPVVPGQTTAPVVPGQTTAPVVPGQTTAPVVPGQTTAPGMPGQTTAPAIPGQSTAPVTPGRSTPPVTPGQTTAPVVPGGTSPPSSNLAADDLLECKQKMQSSDLNGDFMLSETEYISFINQLSSFAFAPHESVSAMPAPLMQNFNALAPAGQINIMGAAPPYIANQETLNNICKLTGQAIHLAINGVPGNIFDHSTTTPASVGPSTVTPTVGSVNGTMSPTTLAPIGGNSTNVPTPAPSRSVFRPEDGAARLSIHTAFLITVPVPEAAQNLPESVFTGLETGFERFVESSIPGILMNVNQNPSTTGNQTGSLPTATPSQPVDNTTTPPVGGQTAPPSGTQTIASSNGATTSAAQVGAQTLAPSGLATAPIVSQNPTPGGTSASPVAGQSTPPYAAGTMPSSSAAPASYTPIQTGAPTVRRYFLRRRLQTFQPTQPAQPQQVQTAAPGTYNPYAPQTIAPTAGQTAASSTNPTTVQSTPSTATPGTATPGTATPGTTTPGTTTPGTTTPGTATPSPVGGPGTAPPTTGQPTPGATTTEPVGGQESAPPSTESAPLNATAGSDTMNTGPEDNLFVAGSPSILNVEISGLCPPINVTAGMKPVCLKVYGVFDVEVAALQSRQQLYDKMVKLTQAAVDTMLQPILGPPLNANVHGSTTPVDPFPPQTAAPGTAPPSGEGGGEGDGEGEEEDDEGGGGGNAFATYGGIAIGVVSAVVCVLGFVAWKKGYLENILPCGGDGDDDEGESKAQTNDNFADEAEDDD